MAPDLEDPSGGLAAQVQEQAERQLEGPGLEPEQEVLTINFGPHHPRRTGCCG